MNVCNPHSEGRRVLPPTWQKPNGDDVFIAGRHLMTKLRVPRKGYFHAEGPGKGGGGRLRFGRVRKGSSGLATSPNALPLQSKAKP